MVERNVCSFPRSSRHYFAANLTKNLELRMEITVVGLGYVGLANAVCLAQHNNVTAVELSTDKVDLVNRHLSPIDDSEIVEYLAKKPLALKATSDAKAAYKNAKYIIIATPTDYDPDRDYFNTSSVESVIKEVTAVNPNAIIIIKSTIPIGFVDCMRAETNNDNIIFSPEFLREGKALYDNLNPSRIIVGEKSDRARVFANLLAQGSELENPPILLMNSKEAEAVKLFANSYLAMRVAYFNELDTYALVNNLESEDIIRGVSHDPRIGNYYNNPSFGYGGYCLPKDTKQLQANFKGIPQSLVSSIVTSNHLRHEVIANAILERKPKLVGVHRLVMKVGSDNFRSASIFEVIERLKTANINIVIYEPSLLDKVLLDCEVIDDLGIFKSRCDVIISNRMSSELDDVANKLFSRDIFNAD